MNPNLKFKKYRKHKNNVKKSLAKLKKVKSKLNIKISNTSNQIMTEINMINYLENYDKDNFAIEFKNEFDNYLVENEINDEDIKNQESKIVKKIRKKMNNLLIDKSILEYVKREVIICNKIIKKIIRTYNVVNYVGYEKPFKICVHIVDNMKLFIQKLLKIKTTKHLQNIIQNAFSYGEYFLDKLNVFRKKCSSSIWINLRYWIGGFINHAVRLVLSIPKKICSKFNIEYNFTNFSDCLDNYLTNFYNKFKDIRIIDDLEYFYSIGNMIDYKIGIRIKSFESCKKKCVKHVVKESKRNVDAIIEICKPIEENDEKKINNLVCQQTHVEILDGRIIKYKKEDGFEKIIKQNNVEDEDLFDINTIL